MFIHVYSYILHTFLLLTPFLSNIDSLYPYYYLYGVKIAKMAPIERITLFKIPNDEDLNRVLEQYKVLAKTAVKVRTYTP